MDEDERRIGRDEMNLAEFPLGMLADRADPTVKTIVFNGEHGRLTITGSDAHGLPTAPDADVIVALLHLTKAQNNFTSPDVTFTRYDLLKLLGWPDRGQYYKRLEESLNRWIGVTLYYEKAWWDNSIKCRVDAKLHILESVVIFDQEVCRTLRARRQALPFSTFSWNKIFFASCQADNLKRLDLTTYFGLRSAVSKQLYRFLDKRFYLRGEWTFDLHELAFEHVGLSRNYSAAKVKEKIRPALEELTAIGFLEPMTPAKRYVNTGRGRWRIRLVRRRAIEAAASPPQAGLPAVVAELVARGITPATAADLAEAHAAGKIAEKLDAFDWLVGRKDKALKRNPAGWLYRAIVDDFAPPPGYIGKAERERLGQVERERLRREDEVRQGRARAREDADAVRTFWVRLSPEDRQRIEAEAIAAAEAETRASCTAGPPALRRLAIAAARDAHIRTLLGLPDSA